MIDRNALINDVKFFAGAASFKVGDQQWHYTSARGRLEVNLSGEPLHYNDDGSFCLTNGQTLGEVLSNARLLGAMVYPAR